LRPMRRPRSSRRANASRRAKAGASSGTASRPPPCARLVLARSWYAPTLLLLDLRGCKYGLLRAPGSEAAARARDLDASRSRCISISMHLDLERDLNRGALEPTRELLASSSRGRSREIAWTVPHGSSYGLVTGTRAPHVRAVSGWGVSRGLWSARSAPSVSANLPEHCK
jgi:hypothetical protein